MTPLERMEKAVEEKDWAGIEALVLDLKCTRQARSANQPRRPFICDDCGGSPNCPPLKDEIWSKVGSIRSLLCVHCFEAKIGRPLDMSDLSECPANDSLVHLAYRANPTLPVENYSGHSRIADYLTKEQINGRPILVAVDPDHWTPCTPEYLNNGGDCHKAPRVWDPVGMNHWHPKREESKI